MKTLNELELIHRNGASGFDNFQSVWLQKLLLPVSSQLLDLRSSVCKKACEVLVTIANQAGLSFGPIFERLTNNSEAVFPKLLCAGSKLIKDCAEECLKEL